MKFRWCRVTAEFDGVMVACSLTAKHRDAHLSESGQRWPWRCGRQRPDDDYKTSRCYLDKGHDGPHRIACTSLWWRDGDSTTLRGFLP